VTARIILLALLLSGCAASPAFELGMVPENLRGCPGAALAPAAISGVVTVPLLQAQEVAVTAALRRTELLRLQCASKVTQLNAWIDAQRRAMRATPEGREK
jgi:hypothetical protein